MTLYGYPLSIFGLEITYITKEYIYFGRFRVLWGSILFDINTFKLIMYETIIEFIFNSITKNASLFLSIMILGSMSINTYNLS